MFAAHWTLPAVVFVSGFGALVMCLLVLRERHPSVRATAAAGEMLRDDGVTRVGHAVAAIGFALIAGLAVIGLVQQGRATRLARAEQQAVAPKIAELREQLRGLDMRIASAESRLGGAEARAASAERGASRIYGRSCATTGRA